MAEQNAETLWRVYKASGDIGLRNQLVLHYRFLVRSVAFQVASGLASNQGYADMESDGTIGLIDAIGKFDVHRGIKFESYAVTRIRGAIIDGLRALDPVSRHYRARTRRLQEAVAELEIEHGRAPSDSEIAEHLGVDIEALRDIQCDAARSVHAVSLDEVLDEDNERSASLADLLVTGKGNPEEAFAMVELAEIVATAIDTLSRDDKTILALRYVEELTHEGIGDVFGFTAPYAYRMLRRALDRMGQALPGSIVVTTRPEVPDQKSHCHF